MPIYLPDAVDVVTNVQSHAAHNLVVQSLVLAQNLVHVLNLAVQSLAALSHAVLSLVAQNHVVQLLAHAHVLNLAAKHAANQFVDVETAAILAADAMVMVVDMLKAIAEMIAAAAQLTDQCSLLHRSLLLHLKLVQEPLTKSSLGPGRLSHHAELLA